MKPNNHHRKYSFRSLAFASALFVFCVIVNLGNPATVLTVPQSPSNAEIQATQSQVSDARAKQDALAEELELAGEDYEEAKANLEAVRTEIRASDVALKEAQKELVSAQEQFDSRAVNIYKNDPISFIEVFMGASDFSELVTRIQFMTQISQQDAEIVKSIRQAKAKLENAKLKLEEQEREQERLAKDASAKQKKAQLIYAEQNAYLNSLNSQLKDLIDKERARLEEVARKEAAAAAERARIAAAAAEAARNQQSNNSNTGGSQSSSPDKPNSSGTVSGGRTFNSGSLGSPNTSVVDIARQYIGKTPYLWGGITPAGFDCSGLTQYCYKKIGISIPRTSRSQYQSGAFIPADRTDLLEPGDLLFFGTNKDPGRIHHVAIYSGNGRMIHAPQAGYKVAEVSLWARINSRNDYVGATRP